MKRILLLGGDSRSLYGLIQFFYRSNVEVFIADCGVRSIVSSSRLAQYVYIPTKAGEFEVYYLDYLESICNEYNIDKVLPVTDQSYWRLKNTLLPSSIGRLVLGYETKKYRELSDKSFVHPIALQYFRTPSLVENIEPNKQYIVKDLFSFSDNNLNDRGGVDLVYGRHLEGKETNKLVYEYITDGVGLGVGLVAESGRVLSMLGHKRIQEVGLAGSALRQTIEIPNNIRESISRFADAVGLDGLNMLEFKVSNGKWYFIELNPRPWGSLPLYLSKPSFSGALSKLLKLPAKNEGYKDAIQINLVKALRNQPLDLLCTIFGLSKVAFDEVGPNENLFVSYLSLKVRSYFSFRLFQIKHLFNGGKKLDVKAYVCFGNINRSALAEALAKDKGENSISYGTIERAGRPRSKNLDSFLMRLGIGANGMSKPFSQDSESYIIFDRFNYEDLVYKLGVDKSRIKLLTFRQIKDPHGLSGRKASKIFNTIRKVVNREEE